MAVSSALMRPAAALADRFGVLRLFDARPEYLYPLLFIVLFQIATMFESARAMARTFLNML